MNFGTVLPLSLKYAVVSAFRCSHSFLEYAGNIDAMMQLWMMAASAFPYADDVCESVVDTLLQMASNNNLRPHIPVVAWEWLRRRPILHPGCHGLKFGASFPVFQLVRDLGDLEIITSYLYIVWSEWSWFYPEGCAAMLDFIWAGFRGIGRIRHQTVLIQRLDDVLSQATPDSPISPEAAGDVLWYREFREALVEMNEEAMEIIGGLSPRAIALFLYANVYAYRISLHFHVCSSPSLSVVICLPPSVERSSVFGVLSGTFILRLGCSRKLFLGTYICSFYISTQGSGAKE